MTARRLTTLPSMQRDAEELAAQLFGEPVDAAARQARPVAFLKVLIVDDQQPMR